MAFDDLKDDEWSLVETLFCEEPKRGERRGRPRVEPRAVVNAVLWVLSTGEGWSKLPGRFPSPPTCRRRFDEWQADGTLDEMVTLLGRSGRQVSLRSRIGTSMLKTAAPPSQHRLRGAFWTNPESWRAPAKLA
ncbi:MAG: transposase [Janthinobacterium lividum]